MKRLLAILVGLLVILCLAQAGALLFLQRRAGWQREAADRSVERGRRVAEASGCFGCHGPGGADPIGNPGSAYGEVPGWGDGRWMLWNRNEADVRAWIEDGHPPMRPPDPDALIRMPAYGALLDPSELDDVVAYVLAVSQFGRLDDPQADEGRALASRLGCFGCHGPEGRGGISNPRSFKGYVPGWDGDDYPELVRDDDEFRQWVVDGLPRRLRNDPRARVFLDRQPIRMPAYGDRIDDAQLDALLAYVRWLRAHPRGR